jgi:hypothetical protein
MEVPAVCFRKLGEALREESPADGIGRMKGSGRGTDEIPESFHIGRERDLSGCIFCHKIFFLY